jgi:CRP-like cAMP-binding protein
MPPEPQSSFDIIAYLQTFPGTKTIRVKKSDRIYLQGGDSNFVYYIQSGKIKLSVSSKDGKEATIGLLSSSSFFGESSAPDQSVRAESASAWTDAKILKMDRQALTEALSSHRDLSVCFIDSLLRKNAQYQNELVDLFFNFSEMRLARILFDLSHTQGDDGRLPVIPKISHEALAKMVGTTRSRVGFFMRRFKHIGLIDHSGRITVKRSQLTMFLQSSSTFPSPQPQTGTPPTGIHYPHAASHTPLQSPLRPRQP